MTKQEQPITRLHFDRLAFSMRQAFVLSRWAARMQKKDEEKKVVHIVHTVVDYAMTSLECCLDRSQILIFHLAAETIDHFFKEIHFLARKPPPRQGQSSQLLPRMKLKCKLVLAAFTWATDQNDNAQVQYLFVMKREDGTK